MRYLVTGAAGFVGSHLAETLLAAGHEVVGVDCFTDYYGRAEKERNAAGRDIVDLDLAEMPLDLAGIDGIFHLAGRPGVRSFGGVFPAYLHDNLLATQRVFEQAAEAGVRVVFASSSSVYGDAAAYPTPEDTLPLPVSPYGLTKLGCEHLARVYGRSSGLDAVVVRYFTVYGPRQRPDMFMRRVCERLLDGAVFEIYGDGRQSRSFTYVGDAVDATIAAMERAAPGTLYNIGGGEEATVLDVIGLLERISGRSLAVRLVDVAKGDVPRTKADVSRIAADLGWRPATPLADGLSAMWSWASGTVAADDVV